MSTLRDALTDYLSMRRALGYKLERSDRLLADFVDYAEGLGAQHVTVEVAVAWATRPVGADPNWHGARLTAVRGFARYLSTLDPATQIPPADVLPGRVRRAVPYLYSDAEIAAIMATADGLRPRLRVLPVTGDDDDDVIGVDEGRDVRTAPLGVVSGAVVGVVTGCPSD